MATGAGHARRTMPAGSVVSALGLLTGLILLAGCGTGFGSIPANEPEVQLLDTEAPVTELTWGTEHNALFGLVSDAGRRLVRIDPVTGGVATARALHGAGGNVGVIPQPFE